MQEMRWLRRLMALVLTLWLCIACSGLRLETPAPDWVLNPPKDTAQWYWGVGEGDDLETARRGALRDIAARLRVSIAGNMESQMTVHNQTVERAARSRISEVVQKTEFTNVTLEKTASAKNGVYALVKVDRQAFIRETLSRLESMDRKAIDASRNLESKTPFEQYLALRAALPHVENAIAAAQLLRVADPAHRAQEVLPRLEALQQKALTAANGLVFSLHYKAADADIAQVVTTFLNANGMRVAPPGGQALPLSITAQAREQMLFGNRNLRLQLTLNLRDERQRNMASKEYLINGNSLNTFEAARQDAMRELARVMNAAGAPSALGIQ